MPSDLRLPAWRSLFTARDGTPDSPFVDAGAHFSDLLGCGHAGNLLANCGLEFDTAPWQAHFNSTIAHTMDDARTGTGSLLVEMSGMPNQANWTAEAECVGLDPDTLYRFGAGIRLHGGDAPRFCHAQVGYYDGGRRPHRGRLQRGR